LDERGSLNRVFGRYRPPPQDCPDYSGRALGLSQCLAAFAALAIGGGAAAFFLW